MADAIALNLTWTRPASILELDDLDPKKAGVYIWGFTIDNNLIPYYVGIADNIIYRIYEHLHSIVSGDYTIYHYNSLVNFKAFKTEKAQVDKLEGKLYEPNWPSAYKTFLQNRKLLQEHIDFMLEKFTFSYAVVNRQMEDLKAIEKICIEQIGKNNLANTRSGRSDKFLINHEGHTSFIRIKQ